ncbi:hypothetical protein GCM10027072_18370 [Streptomyces bullii]
MGRAGRRPRGSGAACAGSHEGQGAAWAGRAKRAGWARSGRAGQEPRGPGGPEATGIGNRGSGAACAGSHEGQGAAWAGSGPRALLAESGAPPRPLRPRTRTWGAGKRRFPAPQVRGPGT